MSPNTMASGPAGVGGSSPFGPVLSWDAVSLSPGTVKLHMDPMEVVLAPLDGLLVITGWSGRSWPGA